MTTFSRPAAALKDKDRLLCGLGHNLLLAAGRQEFAETRFLCLDDSSKGSLVFRSQDSTQAEANLQSLLNAFADGYNRPLPFLPALSLPFYREYCKQREKNDKPAALSAARSKVKSVMASDFIPDAGDACFDYCFAERLSASAFWDDFAVQALLLGPIFLPED